MSCYLRHLKHFFSDLGLEYDKTNRKIIDDSLRKILNMPDAGCPEIWKEVKLWRESGKEPLLLEKVRTYLNGIN